MVMELKPAYRQAGTTDKYLAVDAFRGGGEHCAQQTLTKIHPLANGSKIFRT